MQQKWGSAAVMSNAAASLDSSRDAPDVCALPMSSRQGASWLLDLGYHQCGRMNGGRECSAARRHHSTGPRSRQELQGRMSVGCTCQECCCLLQVRVLLLLRPACSPWGPRFPPACLCRHHLLACTAVLRGLPCAVGVCTLRIVAHRACSSSFCSRIHPFLKGRRANRNCVTKSPSSDVESTSKQTNS